jgi:hypothetical protein
MHGKEKQTPRNHQDMPEVPTYKKLRLLSKLYPAVPVRLGGKKQPSGKNQKFLALRFLTET